MPTNDKQRKQIEKRKKTVLDVLGKGPCTFMYLHSVLNSSERGISRTTVDNILKKLDGVTRISVRDRRFMDGMMRTTRVAVYRLK